MFNPSWTPENMFIQLVLLLSLLCMSSRCNVSPTSGPVTIKIVESPHKNRNPTTTIQKKLQLRAPPAPISGPPHLQVLAQRCFETKHRNYLYHICPFHNVTQKEESSMWNRFHGVLGIWREWIIEDDRFVGMLYSFGEKCGKTDREAKIMFKCSTITKLTNITEPKTCKYTIWMWTPLACFKGAMQVYRVFGAEEISQWESFDMEYRSGLLTKQGLLKRRKQLLLSIGLYYNFTKDEILRNEENNIGDKIPFSTAKVAPNNNIFNNKKDNENCQLRVSELEKELNHTKVQLNNYQNAILQLNPSIQEQIRQFLHNNISTRPIQHNQTVNNQPQHDQTVNNQPQPQHDQPVNNQPQHDQTVNNQPQHDQPVNNQPQPQHDQPVNNQPQPDQPVNNRPQPDQPVNNQPDQPVNNQPQHDQPVNNQPLEHNQPINDRPAVENDQPLDHHLPLDRVPHAVVHQPVVDTSHRVTKQTLDQPDVTDVNDLQTKKLEPEI